MDYYKIINLNKEPFSNSPDPDFFYGSRQHLDCLQKLELALRLRRGLNVIIGDVGTGKTTLCRQLIRRFTNDENFETHLILDPHFTHSTEFLVSVAKTFKNIKPPASTNDWQLKEMIKQYLFHQGVERNRTVILIIDEGQKLPTFCLELLREFLNYETNEYKLLQIVIFAQNEFEKIVRDYANFADRINLYHYLKPMSFRDTRKMIRYRLEKSSKDYKTYTFFSFPALVAIYWATRGYPRKIINLCHRCILTMIIQNQSVVDLFLVRTCIRRVFPGRVRRSKRLALAFGIPALVLVAVFMLFNLTAFNPLDWYSAKRSRASTQIAPQPTRQPPQQEVLPVVEDANPAVETPARSPVEPALPAPTLPPQTPAADIAKPIPATDRPPAADAPPTVHGDMLGKVTITRNETLSGLIQSIYGDFNSKYFKSLILANPQIDDPDLIRVGQIIHMPAIPIAVEPVPVSGWWVHLGQTDSLEEAYRFVKSLSKSAPAVRIIPNWNPKDGMQFALLLAQHFRNRTIANRRLNQLPSELSNNGQLISRWAADTVFFSDPYFGSGSRGKRG